MSDLKFGKHVDAIALGPDGLIAIGTSSLNGQYWDGEVHVCQISDGDALASLYKLPCACGVADVAWAGRSVLAAGDTGDIYVWVVEGKEDPFGVLLSEHDDSVSSLSVCPTSTKSFASGSWDGSVKIWNAESDVSKRTLRGHDGRVVSVLWGTSSLVSAGDDGRVCLWSSKDCESSAENVSPVGVVVVPESPSCLLFSSDEKLLGVGCGDGRIRFYDSSSPAAAAFTLEMGHLGPIRRMSLLPKGSGLASAADDGQVRAVGDIKSAKDARVVATHGDFVRGLVWLPGGHLMSGSWDKQCRLHEV